MDQEQLTSIRGCLRAIKYYSDQKITGRLHFQNLSNQKWNIYYRLGRITWASSTINPNRRLLRHLYQIVNDKIELKDINLPSTKSEDWEYQIITILSKQQKLTQEDIFSLVEGTVSEILFDLIQQAITEKLNYKYQLQNFFSPALVLLDTENCLEQVKREWLTWHSKGLSKFSPNLAPIIKQPQELQEQTSTKVYKNLVAIVDGKRTLRELAALMKKDLILLTKSLIPYYEKGLIDLIKVSDWQLSGSPSFSASGESQSQKSDLALIACIDDSMQTCQVMEHIITEAGYNFMSIQDPVKALTSLIKRKPDLIFLDLIMPVINGYELCAQIRRIPQFKNIPVVILTSHDGIIERVRAKISYATSFMSKPVKAENVRALLVKHLPIQKQLKSSKNALSKELRINI
ncbi:MAG: response regulator [Prochloraceae cyanobacterium]|nr:response regulator [Prochloraceae cyanobacterium]